MKGIFILIDGLGDLPNKQLGDKTPLEAAQTPNMDFLATRGELGYMYPVRPGFIPESDEALVSIFNNPLISSARGQLESRGFDVSLTRGDLAFRVNFATIDNLENGNIVDRRAGRTLTNSEAKELANALNSRLKMPVKFVFEPTMKHNAVLVFRGGFSDNIKGNDATYNQGKTQEIRKINRCHALDDDENSHYAANIVNEFLEKAFEILDKHPVNLERKKRGLMPANYLLVRSPGIEPPKLKQYRKWMSIGYMPLEIGFSKTSGMTNFAFNYPRLREFDAYENLWRGLKKACKYSIKVLKKQLKKYDYCYIHLNETDSPGHDNKPFEKKLMLEYIDITLMKYLRKICPPKNIKVVVTGDHSTPCKLKNHSADPVPVLFYDNQEVPKEKSFCERECRKGSLGRMMGNEILRKVGFGR